MLTLNIKKLNTQGVLKCLEKLQESVLHIKTKKKVQIGNVCLEMSGFGVSLKDYIQQLTLCNILLTTGIILTIHVQNLITVALLSFFKSKFTTNTQNVLHLNQYTHGHI
jgi:hypothetical protein